MMELNVSISIGCSGSFDSNSSSHSLAPWRSRIVGYCRNWSKMRDRYIDFRTSSTSSACGSEVQRQR